MVRSVGHPLRRDRAGRPGFRAGGQPRRQSRLALPPQRCAGGCGRRGRMLSCPSIWWSVAPSRWPGRSADVGAAADARRVYAGVPPAGPAPVAPVINGRTRGQLLTRVDPGSDTAARDARPRPAGDDSPRSSEGTGVRRRSARSWCRPCCGPSSGRCSSSRRSRWRTRCWSATGWWCRRSPGSQRGDVVVFRTRVTGSAASRCRERGPLDSGAGVHRLPHRQQSRAPDQAGDRDCRGTRWCAATRDGRITVNGVALDETSYLYTDPGRASRSRRRRCASRWSCRRAGSS